MSQEYHSSESELSEFEDKDDCDHADHMEKIGEMESGKIDGVYIIPFFCPNCNHFVSEEYEYNGVETI